MSPSNVDSEMDQKFYDELTKSIESFLKMNDSKWNKQYRSEERRVGKEC